MLTKMDWKKHLKKQWTTSTLLILVIAVCGYAQNSELKIGQWKSHIPYNDGRYLTQSQDKIYAAMKLSLMIIDKEDQSLEFLDKVDGLSGVSLGVIKYNPYNNMLVITYKDSNIDLMTSEGTMNLSDIKRAQNLSGDRSINHICFDNQYALLSCGFGLVRLNTDRSEFDFTVFTDGIHVNASTLYDGYYYISTDDGIYRTGVDNENPADFSSWQLLNSNLGFPSNYSSTSCEVYRDTLYFDVNGVLYSFHQDDLLLVHDEQNFSISFMSAEGSHLIIGYCFTSSCHVPPDQPRTQGKVLYYMDGTFGDADFQCDNFPLYAIQDERGWVWFADEWRHIRYTLNVAWGCELIDVNSPYSENSTDMTVIDGELWVASGGITAAEEYLWRGDGFYSLKDGHWTIHNLRNQPKLEDLYDFYSLAVHPSGEKIYAGSYLDGLVEFDGTEYTVYNEKNSSLQVVPSDTARSRVSGLAFDLNENLWISNHSAPRPLSVYTGQPGGWKSFDITKSPPNLLHMAVDDYNNKWVVIGGSSGGIMVFNEGDLDDDFDQKEIYFTTSNSNIPSTKVNCVAVDLDGDVWVGTNDGVAVFECGSSVFEGNCRGRKPKIILNDFVNYLLVSEDVKAIAADGANRKWFGTGNGVFVLSADGDELIATYNEDNSPLLNNTISSIAFNHDNGEVFIGTNKGIISLRNEAIKGGIVNEKSAYAYPNPVRPGYDGPIAIRGLASDANVKITDVNGVLVYETEALGGQAIWNGYDYNGRKAVSGVYLVFSTSTGSLEDPDAIVTKILIVN